MNRSRLLTTALSAALLAFGGAAAPLAAETNLVGGSGEIYTVRAGDCAALLPPGSGCSADSQVLTLEVRRPGASAERLLVPTTEDASAESFPELLYENSSDSLYLLWESWWNGIHPQLNLVSFGPDGWSEVVEITGEPFTEKSEPQLAVTRDVYATQDAEGVRVTRERTVAHVVWRESAGGSDEVRYAPLVLEDGAFIGQNEVFSLDGFAPAPEGSEASSPSAFDRVLAIRPGKERQTVVVAYAHPATGRLVTLLVGVVPGEVGHLGEQVRQWLEERLAAADGPIDVDQLAAELAEQVEVFGDGLDPALLDYLAFQLDRWLRDGGHDGGLGSISDQARQHIIDIGIRLTGGDGWSSVSAPARQHIIDIGRRSTALGFLHQGMIRQLQEWRLPEPVAGPGWGLVSATGENALLAWQGDGVLLYRETVADGWSETRSLTLGPGLGLDQALALLERRVRDR